MPPLSSHNVGYDDDILEIQHHLVHPHPEHHHKTLLESINSLLHVGNGSHHTPGSGIDVAFPSTEEEISEDILIVLFTLVPLIGVAVVISLIAVAVRKMRRSESLQEVARNEFKMSTKSDKGLRLSSPSNTSPKSFSPLSKKSKPNSNSSTIKRGQPSSSTSFHEIRVVPAPQRNMANAPKKLGSLATQLSLESNCSSSSGSSNGSHHSTPVNGPNSLYFSQVPPWYLYSTPYYRSQYHLNKLHRQLSNNAGGGSLHSFGSMGSLHQCNNSSSDNCIASGQVWHTDSEEENNVASSDSSEEKKRKSSKKLKKVLQMMNIPKKIRQHQAEKNRFNIYNIPNETREQLKQIYVY